MKHLKKFNESLLPDKDIMQDIKDICLELEDEGIKILTNYGEATNTIDGQRVSRRLIYLSLIARERIFTSKEEKKFFIKSKETVERLKDYMSQKGYKVKVDHLPIKLGRTASIQFQFTEKEPTKI